MATFQVPQFIDEKPKIVGPLTLRQFFFIAGAFLVSVVSFSILPFFLWMLVTLIVGAVAAALAFVKIHGQELLGVALAGLSYLWKPRTYTWQRATKEIDISDLKRIQATRNAMSIQEKIKSMTMGITIGKIFKDKEQKQGGPDRFQVVTRITGEKVVAKRIDY